MRCCVGRAGRPLPHVAHDMEILRAVLLRAVPRADEAAFLAHLFRRLAGVGDES